MIVGRRRSLARTLLCLFALVLVGAGGAAVSFGAKSGDGREEAREPSANALAQRREADRQLAREREEEEKELRRNRARLATQEEKDARRRSRSAFREQGASEALATGRRHHGATLDRPVALALRDRKGEKVKKYLSDHSALIDLGEGKPTTLVSSMLPLRIDGKPASLKLEDRGDHFRPTNAVSDVRIAKAAGGGVRLESGVSFRPLGDGGVGAQLVEDKAFFANLTTDTDYVVEPQPGGAQALFVLRSADSATAPALSFDLPVGAQLRIAQAGPSAPPGSAEVVRDGKVLTSITPPIAWDADKESVPVVYELDGTTLRVRVNHTDQDVKYPIVVDPNIIDSWWNWSCRCTDARDWYGAQSFGGFGLYNDPQTDSWWKGRGNYVIAWANQHYPGGAWADWRFDAVRAAHIYRVDYRSSHWAHRSRNLMGIWRRHSGGFEGGLRNWGHTFENVFLTLCADEVQHWDGSSPCRWDRGESGNWTVYGLSVDAGWQGAQAHTVAQEAHVYQWDRDDPETWHDPGDRLAWNWHAPGQHSSFRVWGRDRGLGMKRITFGSRLGDDPRVHGCSGDRNSRCPEYWEQWFSYNTNDLPEGKLDLYSHTSDVIQRPSGVQRWWVGVDKTAPTIETFGNGQVKPGSTLGAGTHTLRIDARDIGAGGAENNGVKWIDYQIDGGPWRGLNPNCGSGPCHATAQIDTGPNGLAEGRHRINTRAWDGIRHGSEQGFDIIVDRGAPSVALAGGLWDARGGELRPEVDLSIDATDGEPGGPPAAQRAGVATIRLTINGDLQEPTTSQACDQGSCPLGRRYVLEPEDFAHSSYSIEVEAKDRAGNIDSKTWRINSPPDGSPPDNREYSTEGTEPVDSSADPDAGDLYNCDATDGTICDFAPLATTRSSLGTRASATDLSPDEYGLSDNNRVAPDEFGVLPSFQLFENQAFKNLKVKRLRRIVPWNIVLERDRRATRPDGGVTDYSKPVEELTQWVRKAFASGAFPLVSFEKCRSDFERVRADGTRELQDCGRVQPTLAEYRRATQEFLTYQSDLDPTTKELSDVRLFTAWNEPNYITKPNAPSNEEHQPTSDAYVTGQYWYALASMCPSCNVAAGDFLDTLMPNVIEVEPGRTYLREYRRGMRYARPEAWAWHAYSDAERTLLRTLDEDPSKRWRRFRNFLTATRFKPSPSASITSSPDVWLTEQGATRLRSNVKTLITTTTSTSVDVSRTPAQRARIVTDRILNGLPSVSSRVSQLYYYSMRGNSGFDSGLLSFNPQNTLRANYASFRCKTDPDPARCP